MKHERKSSFDCTSIGTLCNRIAQRSETFIVFPTAGNGESGRDEEKFYAFSSKVFFCLEIKFSS